MNLVKNLGLELPVFGPEEIVSRQAMRSVALRGLAANGLFVRLIDVSGPVQSMMEEAGLATALKTADTELDLLTSTCNAKVVTHQWGLAKAPPAGANGKPHPSELVAVPGYQLAAEVEYIERQETQHYQAWKNEILSGIAKYTQLGRPYRCTDLFTEQFMIGSSNSNPEPATMLADIDLIIYKRHEA